MDTGKLVTLGAMLYQPGDDVMFVVCSSRGGQLWPVESCHRHVECGSHCLYSVSPAVFTLSCVFLSVGIAIPANCSSLDRFVDILIIPLMYLPVVGHFVGRLVVLRAFCLIHVRYNIRNTPFNGPFPGLPRWTGTRKVQPIWIFQKQETVSGSGISWAICKSAPCSRQITTPAPHHSVSTGRMPFLPPNQQRQSTEGHT